MSHAHVDIHCQKASAWRMPLESGRSEIFISCGPDISIRLSDDEAIALLSQLESVLSDEYARTEMLDAAPTTDLPSAGQEASCSN